jgi:trimeric autotransporter adhesin
MNALPLRGKSIRKCRFNPLPLPSKTINYETETNGVSKLNAYQNTLNPQHTRVSKSLHSPSFANILNDMRTIITFLLCTFCTMGYAQDGVAINNTGNAPDASAILDLQSTNKGILAPRMTETQKNAVSSPATGLLIYQTNGTSGFYYYTGTAWTELSSQASGWSLSGNAGTNNGTNFIGTTDAQDLDFGTNNVDRMRITQTGQLEILNTGQSVFIGQQAGEVDDLTSNYNVYVGYRAGYSSVNGYRNTALGAQSLYLNSSGYNNSATGYRALYNNTTGYQNTANGAQSLNANSTGIQNTASGYRSLYFNTDGDQNTGYGFQSLYRNTIGYRNSAVGYQSLRINTEGIGNTANGYRGLYNNATGDYNTGIGYSANSAGSDFDNSTGVGYNADNTASNSVKLGNTSVTSIGGQVGWTTLSDARFKKNIRNDEVKGLEFITGLKPVTYNYDVRARETWMEKNYGEKDETDWEGKYDIEQLRFSGFIAQDVEALSNALGYEFSGVDAPKNDKDIYGLRYADFVVPIVKSVQELNALLLDKNQEIESLKNSNLKLQKQLLENTKAIKELQKSLKPNKE